MTSCLNGARVLVTRPAHQAEQLCQLIAQAGGQAVLFPVLEVTAVLDRKIPATLASLDKFQWLVFTSANAVKFAVLANGGKINPDSAAVAAIGQATAEVLRQADMPVALCPRPPFNSEALLATEPMRQVEGQRILIIRGQDGRDDLAEGLRARGASVDYLDVYRRALPVSDCSPVHALLAAGQLAAVTVTSGEALHNLLAMVDRAYHRQLLALPLVVISDRVRQIAVAKGFKQIAVAGEAADAALLKEVKKMLTGDLG